MVVHRTLLYSTSIYVVKNTQFLLTPVSAPAVLSMLVLTILSEVMKKKILEVVSRLLEATVVVAKN